MSKMFTKSIVIYMLIFNSNFLLQVLDCIIYIFFGFINVSWILVVVKYTLLGVLMLVS